MTACENRLLMHTSHGKIASVPMDERFNQLPFAEFVRSVNLFFRKAVACCYRKEWKDK